MLDQVVGVISRFGGDVGLAVTCANRLANAPVFARARSSTDNEASDTVLSCPPEIEMHLSRTASRAPGGAVASKWNLHMLLRPAVVNTRAGTGGGGGDAETLAESTTAAAVLWLAQGTNRVGTVD